MGKCMSELKEPRSAARRSLGSGFVARQTDAPEYAISAHEIQAARLRARFDFSPSVAATIAALAFPQADTWRAEA